MQLTAEDKSGGPESSLYGSAALLLGSPTVVDLLGIFWRDTERQYFVNELVRLSGHYPRSVQLALVKLETAGVVRSERRANARYFRLDSDHPFAPELAGIIAKVFSATRLLADALATVASVTTAFLRPLEADNLDRELIVIAPPEDRAAVEAAVELVATRVGRTIRTQVIGREDWLRQAGRERSYVRWLIEEERTYVVGNDASLPTPLSG
jgi:hypothetical protein